MKRVVCDLKKVQYASYHYVNQYGDTSDYFRRHTCHGSSYDPKAIVLGKGIMMEDYAIMKGVKDIWTPVVTLQFAANHSVEYKGARAKSIWAEWNRRQFKKQK